MGRTQVAHQVAYRLGMQSQLLDPCLAESLAFLLAGLMNLHFEGLEIVAEHALTTGNA